MSFCTSTTPIPAEGRAGTIEIAKNYGFLHLDHADPRRGSRGNFRNRESLQGVIARSHCKESLQGVMRAIASCKEPSAWSQVQVASTELSASCKCKEPSARSQVHGAKCKLQVHGAKCKLQVHGVKCKMQLQGVKCKLQSLP